TPSTRGSLLLRLRDSQDHAAWMEFVSLYEPATYRILRRHGLQDADARDVMQDFFLTVSLNIDRWDPAKERGSFRGWLRRVARNLVINWLRSRARRETATAIPACKHCSICFPPPRGRRARSSTASCAGPCFIASPNVCAARYG